MLNPGTGLALVSVLTAWTRSREESDLEIFRFAAGELVFTGTLPQHRYSDSRAMHTASSLTGGNSLDAMTSALLVQMVQTVSSDFSGEDGIASARIRRRATVSLSAFGNGQA